MSLNKFTESVLVKPYLNPYFNTLRVKNGLDMDNSGLTNVSSINGVPLPSPFLFDLNPVNIIYKPLAPIVSGSNIVPTWAEVVLKASRVNVSNTLNIYFDNSLSPTCHITSSYDFKGRARFLSYSNDNTPVDVQIDSGIQISNLYSIENIFLFCESVGVSSLVFNSANLPSFTMNNNSFINNTALTDTAVITIDNSGLFIYIEGNAYFRNNGNVLFPFISLLNSSQLTIYYSNNTSNALIMNDTIIDDGSCTLNFYADSSITSYPTFSGITGTYNQLLYNYSSSVSYDDTKQLPAWTTSNVQSSLDHVKSSYLPISSTNSLVTGSISCTSLLSSGTVSCGTNSATVGSLSSGAITSTSTFTNGTNAMTSGAHTCTSLTSSGTISCGTNSATVGSLSSGAITSTGTFTNGTNAMTCGSLSSGAITSSGNFINGTNNITTRNLILTASGSSGIRMENFQSIEAKNTGGSYELAFYPRYVDNNMYIQYGNGLQVRSGAGPASFSITSAGDSSFTGTISLTTVTNGILQKGVAVSGGIANGAFNTNVVLVLGTVTITNSFVTTSCVGVESVVTDGGVVGSYRIKCNNGSYVVTSSSATDTSTLNVFFVKGF